MAVVGTRGWVLDKELEGGRYSNPCESAYVVAARVKASSCSGVSSGGQEENSKEVVAITSDTEMWDNLVRNL